jgi:tungstate transport system substrate-binding protein
MGGCSIAAMSRFRSLLLLVVPLLALASIALTTCGEAPERIRLATTTSTQDSGLLDTLLPVFQAASGIQVDVIAVGTGAAFRMARDGDADLLLVHDRVGEEQFVAEGHGVERRDLMWNSFEILGPADDPAGIAGSESAGEALRRIGVARATFVSRGDDSGTHRREKALWEDAGGRPEWPGYRESGQGMGATLRIADEMGGYVLTDRGTRLRYGQELALNPWLGDSPALRNPYGVVVIDASRHPEIRDAAARKLADWLVSAEAAALIAEFRVGGAQLFHPVRAER